MARLLFLLLLGVCSLGWPGRARAIQVDPCPVAREMAVKGIDLFDLQPAKGLEALKRAYELCPTDLAVGYNTGLAHYLADEKQEARRVWKEVLERFPDHLKTHANLAWVNFELGDDESAHILAFLGLGNYPGNMSLAHTKLFSLFRLGRYLEAYDWLTRAGLQGVRAEKWREQAVGYVVETLWRDFRAGDGEQAVERVVALVKDYPGEAALIAAKDQLVRAYVDPDAEIPFQVPLPHESWAKTGNVDETGEVLDDFIAALPSLNQWQKRGDAFAVITGIYRYRNLPGHHFAERDAANFREMLTRRGLLLGDDEHLHFRVDEEGTRNTLLRDMEWLLRQGHINPNATLIYYYSGLGVPWGGGAGGPPTDALLLPVDTPDKLSEPALAVSLAWFKGELEKLPNQEVWVVIDACFTGHSPCPAGDGSAPLPVPAFFASGKPWGVASMTGPAGAYAPGRQSAFSYFLTKGMLGPADGAGGGRKDDWVEVDEAFAYAREAMAEKAPGQTPFLSHPSRLRLSLLGGER